MIMKSDIKKSDIRHLIFPISSKTICAVNCTNNDKEIRYQKIRHQTLLMWYGINAGTICYY